MCRMGSSISSSGIQPAEGIVFLDILLLKKKKKATFVKINAFHLRKMQASCHAVHETVFSTTAQEVLTFSCKTR